jgi:hypothetical protein
MILDKFSLSQESEDAAVRDTDGTKRFKRKWKASKKNINDFNLIT